MKKISRILLSGILTAFMVVSAIPTGFQKMQSVKAASSTEVSYKLWEYSLKSDGGYDIRSASNTTTHYATGSGSKSYGYLLIPNVNGKVPVTIVMHGIGGSARGKINNIQRHVLMWEKEEGFKPMIYITPCIDKGVYYTGSPLNINEDFRVYSRNYLGTFLKDIIAGKLTDKVDSTNGINVTGWSMGGTASIYAGSKYRDIVKNIAAFSPAQQAYMYSRANGGWMPADPDTKDFGYANLANGKTPIRLMAGSIVENKGEAFRSINNYMDKFGEEKDFTRVFFKTGEHDLNQFKKDFFVFLYMMNHDGKLPTQDYIKGVHYYPTYPNVATFGDDALYDSIIFASNASMDDAQNTNSSDMSKLTGTVVIKGNFKVGEKITASVENGNADEYVYLWQRGINLTGTKTATYTITQADAGQQLKCVVRAKNDPNGDVRGQLVSAATKVQAANTTTPLSGNVVISGKFKVGQTLTVTVENGNADDYIYLWQRGINLTGVRTSTYKITDADAGQIIKCVVRDKNDPSGEVRGQLVSPGTKVSK